MEIILLQDLHRSLRLPDRPPHHAVHQPEEGWVEEGEREGGEGAGRVEDWREGGVLAITRLVRCND